MKKYRSRQKLLGWLGFAMLALIAICFALPTFGTSLLLPLAALSPKLFIGTMAVVHKGVFACAAFPFGMRILRDKTGGEGGESAFETKVLKGVETLVEENKQFKSIIQKVQDDFDRADKEAKKAMEELTRVKNQTNTSYEELVKRMEKVQRQIGLTARSSFRSPIERALANEELRFYINATARYIASCYEDAPGNLKKCDPAFVKAVEDGNASVKIKALTGIDAGLGQATVPTDTFNEIYDLMLEYGDYTSLGVQRVGARLNVVPVATSRPQFYWIGNQSSLAEGSTITSGAFGGSQVLSVINTCAVLMYVARELLQDSTVDLAPYVLRQIIESTNWGIDTAAFIGTGNQDTTNAGYVGIFNAALTNTNMAVAAGAGRTLVGSMKLDDFVACTQTVSPEVLNRKPMWWAHTQMMYLMLLIRDSVGRPIFQTWNERPDISGVLSLLGRPVRPTAVAPTTNAAGQPVIVFGDPQGQAVHIREDLELATSEDIGFPQNLMAYRALVRAGVKLKTLAGSTTLKPFAVLSTAPF